MRNFVIIKLIDEKDRSQSTGVKGNVAYNFYDN